MLELIIQAIRHNAMVYLDYPPGVRLIEPHAVGFDRDGQLLLRAFQIDGASATGKTRHWKLFRLDRAEAINPANLSFDGPEPGYRRGDQAMVRGVIAEL